MVAATTAVVYSLTTQLCSHFEVVSCVKSIPLNKNHALYAMRVG